MAFEILTDSSSNLTPDLALQYNIQVLPLHYICDGVETKCYDPETSFDGKAFYDLLRGKKVVRTSMINSDQFISWFEEILKKGSDILYISMSSGISGTYAAGAVAAQTLLDRYPDRAIRVVDTLGASLGEGLFAIRASQMRAEGKTVHDAAAWVEENRQRMCQVFTVDDLMFLRRGGRLSGLSAVLGSLINIKPLLKGNEEGKIVVFSKLVGRKKALQVMANLYAENVADPQTEVAAIAHGDCEDDARYLIEQMKKRVPGIRDIICRVYEPGTGAHVGPGALALFFFGRDGSFRRHHLALIP